LNPSFSLTLVVVHTHFKLPSIFETPTQLLDAVVVSVIVTLEGNSMIMYPSLGIGLEGKIVNVKVETSPVLVEDDVTNTDWSGVGSAVTVIESEDPSIL
jgi:hypothetical protein